MKTKKELPADWFPRFNYESDVKVISHWTAGGYNPGDLEKSHYHFLIDGEGNIHLGFNRLGQAAPHTYGFNWEIGIGICCMAGAQSNYKHGQYPMKKVQWEALIQLVARLVEEYGIQVTKQRVLTHAEVTKTLGVDQWGKWDIAELSFAPAIKDPGTDLRTRVLDITQKQEITVGRNVLMKLGDNEETFVGLLTNASTFLPVRKLEKAGFLQVKKISRGKDDKMYIRVTCGNDGARVPLMLVDEVGHISVRDFQKLGYTVTYAHHEKLARCIKKPTGEMKPENS